MVAMYNVFGRQVGSHWVRSLKYCQRLGPSLIATPQLAMATLGVTFGGTWLATRGGPAKKDKKPPTNSTSKDEEQFIRCDLPREDSQPDTDLMLENL